MKRISNEDGLNAGWRNIGRLALFSIPWVLGAGALVWLGFLMGVHNWFNQLSQERRRAVYVGAENAPKSKLRIETPNSGCIKITRVDLDGSTAAVYFKSECTQATHYGIKIHWQLFSPDGTALGSGYGHTSLLDGPKDLNPGEKGEAIFSGYYGISLDKRAESIRFWTED